MFKHGFPFPADDVERDETETAVTKGEKSGNAKKKIDFISPSKRKF